jgi:sulfur-carrier protein
LAEYSDAHPVRPKVFEFETHQLPRIRTLDGATALALAPSFPARYNLRVTIGSQTIRVKVLFFGRLIEVLGHREQSVELAGAATIEQLFSLFSARHPSLAQFRSSLIASRNQEFAAWDTPLDAGDEVAFLPPVSGG